MPADRPYRSSSLDTLYGRAKDHWGSAPFLEVILDELALRTTPAAKRLRDEISARAAHLRETEQRIGTNGSGAPSREGLAEELARLRADKEAAERRVAELQAVLLQARETIRWQEQKLTSAAATNGHGIYRRVGLDEHCPDFVLRAVRTAYRKELHPDARPPEEKAVAERRFKEAEAVFGQLFALRKLR
jgi:hypothetical protein